MPDVTIERNDTVETVARAHGVPRQSILDAPQNAVLFETRSGQILFEGDVLFVPDDIPTHRSVASGGSHTFVVRSPVLTTHVRFSLGGSPRRGEPCVVCVDGGENEERVLDGTGLLTFDAPPDAEEARVTFYADTDYAEEILLELGHLDPVAETRGAQHRLNNMAFDCGAEDGDAAERTRAALAAFQLVAGEGEPSGELNDETRDRLTSKHQS